MCPLSTGVCEVGRAQHFVMCSHNDDLGAAPDSPIDTEFSNLFNAIVLSQLRTSHTQTINYTSSEENVRHIITITT